VANTGSSSPAPRPRRTWATAALAVAAALAITGWAAWPWTAYRTTAPPATPRHRQTAARTAPRRPAAAARPAGAAPNYDSLAWDADPRAVVDGRVPGISVVDSVVLGAPRGVRTVALLVRGGPEDTRPTHHVFLASGPPGSRTIRRTGVVGIGNRPAGTLGFGAVDVDGDGVREPYVVGWDGGTGRFEIDVALMHPNDVGAFEYRYNGAWADLDTRGGDLASDTRPPPGPRTRRWLERMGGRVADAVDPIARDPEVLRDHAEEHRWLAEHGRGFHEGPLHPRWYPGGLPSWLSDVCQARDGDLGWMSPYRSNVYAVDHRRHRHFILRVPDTSYESAAGLVVGRRYVWLGNTAKAGGGYGLLAWDRRRERMVTVPIPELRAKDWNCGDGPVCRSPRLSLRGGRILADSTILTLPDSIDPRVELAGAASCRT
jgi:hypothetical protein